MDDLLRNEIAEASREHDKLMAEDHEWMARRNAAQSPPVSETPSPGIVAKDYGRPAAPRGCLRRRLEPMGSMDGRPSRYHARRNPRQSRSQHGHAHRRA